jgi:hypothetical protein
LSALPAIRCAGAPRDLGFDQGAALRAVLRRSLRPRAPARPAELREWLPASQSARAWRDVAAFFPHHAERMLGLARGARVPVRLLAARLRGLLTGDGGLAAGVSAERAGQALLARSIGPGLDAAPLFVRHSAPDNDYRSVELTPAWSVAAALGVNEHGLAATATALPGDDALLRGCAAPAALLVQDVLQRFDGVDKAVEWALSRPAGGSASLLLADATGRVAGVRIEGRQRSALAASDGLVVGLGSRAALESLSKAASESPLDAAGLARLLREPAAGAPLVAVADPVLRRIGFVDLGGRFDWYAIEGLAQGEAPTLTGAE